MISSRAAALKVGDDKNALTSKNAQDLYKAYEDTAADLHENVNLVARQVEINLDWASDVERDPAAQTTFGSDPSARRFSVRSVSTAISTNTCRSSIAGSHGHRDERQEFADIDWYSAKHHVFTIAYCFQTTHKTWMETVRQWASQSTLNQAAIDEFLAEKTDQQLQAQAGHRGHSSQRLHEPRHERDRGHPRQISADQFLLRFARRQPSDGLLR